VKKQYSNRRSMGGSRNQLLAAFLEEISGTAFVRYPDAVKTVIHRRAGVYALYKGDKLYYVGLASNLMSRLKAHLRDRHKGLWDRFSVYLVHDSNHIRQLEALLLRIAKPPGNHVRGRMKRSSNLSKLLQIEIKRVDENNRAALFGVNALRIRRKRITRRTKGTLMLSGLIEKRMSLRGERNGKKFKATLRRDGYTWYKGKRFESPSGAARAALGRIVNGWTFWRYRKSASVWVRLQELRD
jgi:hypothetical protein